MSDLGKFRNPFKKKRRRAPAAAPLPDNPVRIETKPVLFRPSPMLTLVPPVVARVAPLPPTAAVVMPMSPRGEDVDEVNEEFRRPSYPSGSYRPASYYDPPYDGPPGETPMLTSDDRFSDTEENYLSGLGADSGGFFTDLYSTVVAAQKTRADTKLAQAQAAQAQALALQRGSFRPSSGASFLGLSTTTLLMIAGAGLGAYLLMGRKKR